MISFIRIICFNECPWATFVAPPRSKLKFQGFKDDLYSESRKKKEIKDSLVIFLFLITFSTFFGNFNDINWFYWLQYIAIVQWSRTARLLTTNNPRYFDNDTFSALSVVTFNGLFSITESYLFLRGWGGGVRLPALWLKASTPLTYFAEGQRTPFKILYWRKLLLFYIPLTLIARLCVYQIEIHFHSLTCLNSTDISQLFLGFMNFNKQFFK